MILVDHFHMGLIHYLHIPLFLFYLLLFLWVILRSELFEWEGVNRKHFAGFFLLKAGAGVALTLIYTYYYTDASKADIYRYFKDSKVISSVLFSDPAAWLRIITGVGMYDAKVFTYLLPTLHFSHPTGDLATSNTLIIRFISILNYFSFYNIYIDTLFFDFLSFVGLVWLFNTFKSFMRGYEQLLYLPLFLLPSVIFWGSGLLKESIIIFAIGLYLRSVMQKEWSWWNILLAIVAMFIIASTKVYIAGILIVATAFLPLPISNFKRVLLFAIVVLGGWYITGAGFCEKIIDKRNEFITLAQNENSGSSVDTQMTQADCGHLFPLLPSSSANVILRPFVWEKGKIFQMAFGVENTLLLLLLAYLLIRYFKLPERKALWVIAFCFVFALANYAIIGLSIPVMGAIVHYRIIASIFMIIAILSLVNYNRYKTELN